METHQTLGRKISMQRRQLRLSQGKTAEDLGVRRATISDWENDREQPYGENLVRVCEYLGIALGPHEVQPTYQTYQLVLPFEPADLELRVTRKSAESVQLDLTLKRSG